MDTVLLVIHILIALALVATVLLQRSEGGALGMGGGPSGFMSARGAGNALTRLTAILAGGFFLTSIALTILARQEIDGPSILDQPVSESPVPLDAPDEDAGAVPAPASGAPEAPASESPAPDSAPPAVPLTE